MAVSACERHDSSPPVPRARTTAGLEFQWRRNEVSLEPVKPSPSSGVSSSDLLAALTSAAESWNMALRGCGTPLLRVQELREAGTAREDGRNLVTVRGDTWCPPDGPTVDCYNPSRQATTHIRPYVDGPRAGEIREADIEINAVHYRWSLNGGEGKRSLRAVLGHELGHVLGLAHACSDRRAADLFDTASLSACTAVTSRSIMYPDSTEPGRPLVLSPGPDAIAGLCRAGAGGAFQ